MKKSNGGDSRFIKSIINENAVLKTALGICPALAVTSTALGGLSMGILTLIVLVCSNLTVSALCGFIPKNVRIPIFLVVAAMFTTAAQILSKSFLPVLNDTLVIYFPLITVSCVLMCGFKPTAQSKRDRHRNESAADILLGSLTMGASFALTLSVIGIIREIIGMGTVFGFALTKGYIQPMLIASTAPGGFLTLGFLAALIKRIADKNESRAAEDDGDAKTNDVPQNPNDKIETQANGGEDIAL